MQSKTMVERHPGDLAELELGTNAFAASHLAILLSTLLAMAMRGSLVDPDALARWQHDQRPQASNSLNNNIS
ncbi:hypothetical protein X744_32415 [Mesorhizobium sp. LNJC372A00]|nr:hypothetical protein X745_32585 [Mesorhizobium sp. LNJC374B00]ESY48085.1 hypothetical protein X744_32415 [Mesorhizobium sp. LNJC372A00]